MPGSLIRLHIVTSCLHAVS